MICLIWSYVALGIYFSSYDKTYVSHALFLLIKKLEFESIDMNLKIELIRSNNPGLNI